MDFKTRHQHATVFSAAGMTDIVFLLLIFFLLSSSFVVQPGIKVKLPQTVVQEVPEEKQQVMISIDENEVIYINGKRTYETELLAELAPLIRVNPDQVVIIQADKDVRHEVVIKAMDYARRAGASKLHIATAPVGD